MAKTTKQTEIQTVICAKTRFKTLKAAKKWIKDHDFKTSHEGKPADETSSSFRFRQRDPGDFQSGSFRTITLDRGVSAVIGKPKKKTKAVKAIEAINDGADILDVIDVLTKACDV